MNIEDLTIAQAKQIAKMFGDFVGGNSTCSFEIGKAYFIRTVTMHHTGRVVGITDSDIVLDDAAWIADSGRFATALRTGELSEVEPFPGRAYVSRAAIVDFCEWDHALPREQE